MEELPGDRGRDPGEGELLMRRIVLAVGLCGLLAACGQEAKPVGPDGAPAQELDYIDAVPIDEDAPVPVAEPQTAAKKEEPEEDREEAEEAEDEAEAEAAPAPARTTPPAATPSSDAASATRRANEAVAPRSSTEVPYSPN